MDALGAPLLAPISKIIITFLTNLSIVLHSCTSSQNRRIWILRCAASSRTWWSFLWSTSRSRLTSHNLLGWHRARLCAVNSCSNSTRWLNLRIKSEAYSLRRVLLSNYSKIQSLNLLNRACPETIHDAFTASVLLAVNNSATWVLQRCCHALHHTLSWWSAWADLVLRRSIGRASARFIWTWSCALRKLTERVEGNSRLAVCHWRASLVDAEQFNLFGWRRLAFDLEIHLAWFSIVVRTNAATTAHLQLLTLWVISFLTNL